MIGWLAACTPDEGPAVHREIGVPELEGPSDPGVGPVRFWTLHASRPVAVTLAVEGGGEQWTLTSPEGLDHRIPIVGLLPGADYEVRATAGHSRARTQALATLRFTAEEPPPLWFWPTVDVLAADDRAEPGWTLIPVVPYGRYDEGLLLILDDQQRVRWWMTSSERKLYDAAPDGSGGLWIRDNPGIEHVAYDGDVVARFEPDPEGTELPLDARGVDHEVIPDGEGGFWTYGHQARAQQIPADYGSSELVDGVVDDTPFVHVGADGHVLKQFEIAPVLDPAHAGFNALDPLPHDEVDFVHANGGIPLDDGGAIVSLRDQDVVMRLDADGQIRWMLGDPSGWSAPWQDKLLKPVGTPSWPYHAHGPQWLADRSLLLIFDNHLWGRTPYEPELDGPQISRAVAYRVDEQARTVELAWEDDLTSTGSLFSGVMGEVDELPITHHRLAVWGYVLGADHDWGKLSARVVELVPDAPGDPALDLQLRVDRDAVPDGIWVYRAERGIPPLHP